MHSSVSTRAPTDNAHPPHHLREVCQLLARGMVRLRSRMAEEATRQTDDPGDNSLRDTAPQRRHANPTSRRRA